jgi:predicted O-methyltransferase YrrM
MVVGRLQKTNVLLSLLKDRPLEVFDRLSMQASDLWRTHRTPKEVSIDRRRSWMQILHELSATIGEQFEEYRNESHLRRIQDQVRHRIEEKLSDPPFTLRFNGDRRLAELCYLACRAMKPSIVVETGVAYGVTSAYILQALHLNGRGALHSIDLPPLSAASRKNEHYIGILIPEHLRDRWELHRGTSKRVLPRVLEKVEAVDIACLDSRSSYKVKFHDLSILGRYLTHPGLIVVDDVGRTSEFLDWSEAFQPTYAATAPEIDRNNYFGVAANGQKKEPGDQPIVASSK